MIEPIYLRYVHDSLSKGSLNSENAATLPLGFIGLYEQEFTQKTPASERKKVLHQLALWALFKGPVSANMAAAVLELEEEQMKDLVDTYSSWFNSPESGKYQLYHERLRVYLLQKLKAKEVQALNEKLISFLQDAINQAKGEEYEFYALEFLHQHMALESQLGNHYERLHSYVNQESLWRRQIQLSKGYAWSQNALQQGIKEGARRNHEMNTIRSTVNIVKLMTQEQNSTDDILNLLNEGDYPTALKRAESWEGERQFKLYLLFIHELTIGTSSEADFRKEACKAVIEVIDQTPEDHSVLDWCKFYPELAIYKYHEELLKMELDGMVIWKRGKYTLNDLIGRKNVNISIIKNLVSQILDYYDKSIAYTQIAIKLMENGNKYESEKIIELSIKWASLIKERTNIPKKSYAYNYAIEFLIKQGLKKKASKFSVKSLKLAAEITDIRFKSIVQNSISVLLMQNEDREESLRLVSKIKDDTEKSSAYFEISQILMKQGKKEESLKMALLVKNEYKKSDLYAGLSNILMKQGDKEESKLAMRKSLNSASEINSEILKSRAFAGLSKMLVKHGDKEESKLVMQKSLSIAVGIDYTYNRNNVLLNILKIFTEQDEMDSLKIAVKESLKVESKIKDKWLKFRAYAEISKLLMEQGKKEESLKVISDITNEWERYRAYEEISKILMKQGKKEESLKVVSEITNDYAKSSAFAEISKLLMEQGKKEESFKVASIITDELEKSFIYAKISKMLMEQGYIEESKTVMQKSLTLASMVNDEYDKPLAYLNISKILMDLGKNNESREAMKESLSVASEISNDWNKYQIHSSIAESLIEMGDREGSILIASKIKIELIKQETYGMISKILMEKGKKKESLKLGYVSTFARDECYKEISKVLMKQRNKGEAIQIAEKIKVASDRVAAFTYFGKTLSFEEAQNCLSMISSEDNQSAVIKGMSERIKEQMELSEATYPYLYHHSKYIEYLSNILFHQAQMACFFEEERNEEKLDMLSEVLEIKDWRKISA